MYRFEKLEVWQEAITLLDIIYSAIEKFPPKEKNAITDQLRRAALSIANNVAEGSAGNDKEFRAFLTIARRSQYEVANLLFISKRFQYIEADEFEKLMNQVNLVGRLLSGLIRTLNAQLTAKSQ